MLNPLSLCKHITDLKTNQRLNACDAICLQETWLNSEEESAEIYYLQDKTASYVSVGDSRGIANYFSSKFVEGMKIAKPNYQIAAIESKEIMIINIYRSSGPFEVDFNEDFTNIFESNHGQNIILAIGDFNFCEREEAHHPMREMLLQKEFQSLLYQVPGSTTMQSIGTHIKGRCLDQAYQWSRDGTYDLCTASVWTSSFSDHDPIFVEIRLGDEQNITDNCDAFSKVRQAWSEKTFTQATAQAKQAEGSPQITKKPRPAVTTAKFVTVTSSGFETKHKSQIQTTARTFTNPADKSVYVNEVFSGKIAVRCWMNASLQLLSCGSDHKGDSGWQSLQSKWGLILSQFRRHIEYKTTHLAIRGMPEQYNLGDPHKVFDNILNSDYKICDIKHIFCHRVTSITIMNNCSHTSENPTIDTRVMTLLPLPPDNSDMNHYMEQPLVDNTDDYICEACEKMELSVKVHKIILD